MTMDEHADCDRQLCEAEDKILALNKRIKELEAQLEKHRWIPVSERLPEKTGEYQVVRKINQYPTTREYSADSLMWHSFEIVTHWRPIILLEQDASQGVVIGEGTGG